MSEAPHTTEQSLLIASSATPTATVTATAAYLQAKQQVQQAKQNEQQERARSMKYYSQRVLTNIRYQKAPSAPIIIREKYLQDRKGTIGVFSRKSELVADERESQTKSLLPLDYLKQRRKDAKYGKIHITDLWSEKYLKTVLYESQIRDNLQKLGQLTRRAAIQASQNLSQLNTAIQGSVEAELRGMLSVQHNSFSGAAITATNSGPETPKQVPLINISQQQASPTPRAQQQTGRRTPGKSGFNTNRSGHAILSPLLNLTTSISDQQQQQQPQQPFSEEHTSLKHCSSSSQAILPKGLLPDKQQFLTARNRRLKNRDDVHRLKKSMRGIIKNCLEYYDVEESSQGESQIIVCTTNFTRTVLPQIRLSTESLKTDRSQPTQRTQYTISHFAPSQKISKEASANLILQNMQTEYLQQQQVLQPAMAEEANSHQESDQ